MSRNNYYTANEDIRDYMADHGVSQTALADQMGVSVWKVNTLLKHEMTEQQKEDFIRRIDAIANDRIVEHQAEDPEYVQETAAEGQVTTTKFQIGDRVKIPSKSLSIGIIIDIWQSMALNKVMYAVDCENGSRGMYAEAQLEPAPIPIAFSWEAHIDGNVAVVTMNATQGEKTWVYARGHAHILHSGEVGMAQAVSFAARRMFEELDSKQESPIYLKEERK